MSIFKRIFTLGRDEVYEEAIRFFNDHNYREAIGKFEEILSQKHSTKSLHYNLSLVYVSQSHRNIGIVLFASGNYMDALEEFRTALHFNPGYNELNYFIGVCLNNLGDFKGAIESFNAVLGVDPQNLPAALRLGVALHNNKMWDRAIALYQETLLRNPGYADIHYHLGLAYLGHGQVSRALKSFEEALAINPSYLQPRIKTVVAQIHLGRLDDALKNLTGLIDSFPGYADLYYYLGLVHSARNELEKAVEGFRRALDINPSYREAKMKLSAVYCYLERFELALRELEELKALEPADGNVAMLAKAISGAVAASGDKKFSAVLKRMLKDREITRSIPEFNRSVLINPGVSEMVSVIMGVASEDQSLCEMLVPLVKDHIGEHLEYPDMHNSLGTLYVRLNRLADAEVCFSEALRLNGQYLQARVNLFYVQKSLRKYEEAKKQGDLIRAAGVSYPDFYCALAELHLEAGEFDRGLSAALRACDLNPLYGRAHCLIGQCCEGMGERGRAIEHFTKCLETKPTADVKEVAEEHLLRLGASIS